MKKAIPLWKRGLYAEDWMRIAIYCFEINNELGMWIALLDWAEAIQKERK